MATKLRISVGQCSDKGVKPLNQDFHAFSVPKEPALSAKGIAVALADGISSSEVSQIASQTSVNSFLEDYFATPESWSVKTAVKRVMQATNSWLYAQTRNGPYRYVLDKGYVCTFSALVIKSATAHIFHVGDARVYRVSGSRLEQLTEDHRLWVSSEKSYLSRALGMRDCLEFDYQSRSVEAGDLFILATDGVYEFAEEAFILAILEEQADDLDRAARLIVDRALSNGSGDNLTVQIVRVDELPQGDLGELHRRTTSLPFPPELRPRMAFDGYDILRELHHSNRSHVYLASDRDTGQQVILKTPSVDLRNDSEYLDRFMMEEWVARRIDNAHVLKPCDHPHKRRYLYVTSEYIEGCTLAQWILDHPQPDLETVRKIVEQIALGLHALHRQEMLHQDLRPNNIMIDRAGTAKIIDFGSVRVAGLAEMGGAGAHQEILGTAQFTAPEYFVGDPASPRSDQFSLGVIVYHMLSGQLPYGVQVARATTHAAQRRLIYRSVREHVPQVPAWVDAAIRKAVHPNPYKRYDEISEFIFDLRHPNPAYLNKAQPPLIQRNPLLFWKGLSLLLFLALVMLIATRPVGGI
jgi:serine/threonine protein phosphatase PrpC